MYTNSDSKLKKMKNAGHKLVTNSSVFGLPRIFQTENILVKIIWLVMILFSSSCGLYVIGKNITDFFQYDVSTQIKLIKSETMTFPSIVICDNIAVPNITNKIDSQRFKESELSLSRDFESFRLGEMFDCLRFNGYRNPENTLNLFEVNSNDSLNTGLSLRLENVSNSRILIYIRDYYENHFVSSSPLFIATEELNMIVISKIIDRKIGEPYASCEVIPDQTYRRNNCIEECIEKKIASKYNCSNYGYYRSVNNFCEFSMRNKYLIEFKNVCNRKCPQECDSTRYDVIASSSKVKFENLTGIEVRLSSLDYTEFSQVPMVNIFSLISNIGGALGLFIGLQFLSLIEFVEFVIEITSILL